MSDAVNAIKATAIALERLMQRGLSLHEEDDPRAAVALMAETEKSYLTATLNFRDNDFTRQNCLWLILRDEADQICGMAGVRTDDIPERGWVPFWAHHYKRTSSEGTGTIDLDAFPPVAEEMSGRCAYIGDLWLRAQSRVDIPAFAILLQYVATTSMGADWVYSFVRDTHARLGQTYNFRLSRCYPSVHRWIGQPAAHRSDSDWLLCSDLDDVRHAMRVYGHVENASATPRDECMDRAKVIRLNEHH